MLKALLESLVNSQNEVNTISQVISTSERIYSNGKENYENAEKEIPDAEKALTDASSEWNKAKDMMDELSRAQSALDAAKEKLLNASTEAERIAAQAELDAERRKWQELMDKVLAYSEKEIAAAQKLGDKALEKQWTECHDHLKTDNTEMSKALDSMSDNMEKYFNDLNADGSKNEDYKRAAQVNDATYIEYSADAKLALEKMKALESALVAYAQHLLDEAKRLLAIAEGDLSMSLDQAKKALEMAKIAQQNAADLYEQAKQLLDTANSIAEKALRNVQTIEEYLRKKGISEEMTDDEFVDKRLKEVEDYLEAIGYKYSIDWDEDSGNSVLNTFTKFATKGIKENTWYKVVGRKSNGTLFLGEDLRLYKITKPNQLLVNKNESRSGSHKGDFESEMWRYGITLNLRLYADVTYNIIEVDGDTFVMGIHYSNVKTSSSTVSSYYQISDDNGYSWRAYPYPDYSGLTSTIATPSVCDSGFYTFNIRAKIFSKELIGF